MCLTEAKALGDLQRAYFPDVKLIFVGNARHVEYPPDSVRLFQKYGGKQAIYRYDPFYEWYKYIHGSLDGAKLTFWDMVKPKNWKYLIRTKKAYGAGWASEQQGDGAAKMKYRGGCVFISAEGRVVWKYTEDRPADIALKAQYMDAFRKLQDLPPLHPELAGGKASNNWNRRDDEPGGAKQSLRNYDELANANNATGSSKESQATSEVTTNPTDPATPEDHEQQVLIADGDAADVSA